MSYTEENMEYSDRSVGYEALSNPRRRYVIRLLDEADSSMNLDELATEIVRWEDDDDSVPEEKVRKVRLLLYHSHVPKLSEAGFVRYNREQEQVSLSELAPMKFIERIEE